jgi:hypothetical protein
VVPQDPEIVGERDYGLFGFRLGKSIRGLYRDELGNRWYVAVGLRSREWTQRSFLRHEFQSGLAGID